MAKYEWAENKNKLQRAIERVRNEQQPVSKKDARIKELYISFGGKVIKVKEDDTTNNPEDNKTTSKIESDHGGQSSPDNSPTEQTVSSTSK